MCLPMTTTINRACRRFFLGGGKQIFLKDDNAMRFVCTYISHNTYTCETCAQPEAYWPLHIWWVCGQISPVEASELDVFYCTSLDKLAVDIYLARYDSRTRPSADHYIQLSSSIYVFTFPSEIRVLLAQKRFVCWHHIESSTTEKETNSIIINGIFVDAFWRRTIRFMLAWRCTTEWTGPAFLLRQINCIRTRTEYSV